MQIQTIAPLRCINTPTYVYDEAQHLQFRQLLVLLLNHQVLKRDKDTGRVFKATIEECLEHELPIGEHINEGIWRPGAHRLSIVDIRVTRNVLVDIECKENPAYAWRVGERLFAVLKKKKIVGPNAKLGYTKHGVHIYIGIPPIFSDTPLEAIAVNEATKLAVQTQILPLLDSCCRRNKTKLKIDKVDISTVVSPEGTVQYPNKRKDDMTKHHDPVLRHFDNSDDTPIERFESEVFQAMILKAKEKPPKPVEKWADEQYVKTGIKLKDATIDEIEAVADDYIEKHKAEIYAKAGRKDRSALLMAVAYKIANDFGREAAIKAAAILNERCESPFDSKRDAIAQVEYGLRSFRPRHKTSRTGQYDNLVQEPPDRRKQIHMLNLTEEETTILAQWKTVRTVEEEGAHCGTTVAYADYCAWCKEQQLAPIGSQQFARWLQTQGNDKTIRVNGKQVRGILNCKLLLHGVPEQPALLPESSSHLEVSTGMHAEGGRLATHKAAAKKKTVRLASSVWAWFLAESMDSTSMTTHSLFPAKHTFYT